MSRLNKGRVKIIAIVIMAAAISVSLALLLSKPNKVYSTPTDLDITSDTTWTGSQTIYGTLTVKSGYTLTLDPASNAQIIITADHIYT